MPGNVTTGSGLGTTSKGQPTASGGSINGTYIGHRHLTRDRSLPLNSDNVTPLVGLGGSPAGNFALVRDHSGLICYGRISARVFACTAQHAHARMCQKAVAGLAMMAQ